MPDEHTQMTVDGELLRARRERQSLSRAVEIVNAAADALPALRAGAPGR
ncbi:hypothetical protein AB0E74_27815 [Streptomyces sp. NPDC030392]